MYCKSSLFILSGLVSVAVALPAQHKPSTRSEMTTVNHETTSTHVVTTVAHTEAVVTTVAHLESSSPVSLVTTANSKPTPVQGMDKLVDLITATVLEIGVFPPEQKWTTIHLHATSTTLTKTHKTGKATKKTKPVKVVKPTKTGKTGKTKVAPTHVAPSTCTTYYPTIMRQISETFPSIVQENTANTTKAFHVGQSVSFSDKVKFNRIHQYIAFDNIKPGSWDCQLMVSWPNLKQGLKVTSSSTHGSSATSGVSLEVYRASFDASAYGTNVSPIHIHKDTPDNNGPFATWDTMMTAIKLSGNRQLPASDSGKGQEKSDVPTSAKLTYFGTVGVNPGEYGVTINSEACPASGSDSLQYLFEIPDTDSREDTVNVQFSKEKGAGVYMIANC